MQALPAYILAGGQSRRFGSDKARANVDGLPTIVRLSQSLRSAATSITVVAERAGKYEDYGLQTIADLRPGAGPLAGLEAVAIDCTNRHERKELDSPWFIVVACDVLTVNPSWFAVLDRAREPGALVSVFQDTTGVQPLVGLYHAGVLPHVQSMLSGGERCIRHLLRSVKTSVSPAPDDWSTLTHFNTRIEFERILKAHSAGRGEEIEEPPRSATDVRGEDDGCP